LFGFILLLLTPLLLLFFVMLGRCFRLLILTFPNVGLRIRIESTFLLGSRGLLLRCLSYILETLGLGTTLLWGPLSGFRLGRYVGATPGRGVDEVDCTLLAKLNFATLLGVTLHLDITLEVLCCCYCRLRCLISCGRLLNMLHNELG
jgi:hypothetical protein